jgi:hypothetical protein
VLPRRQEVLPSQHTEPETLLQPFALSFRLANDPENHEVARAKHPVQWLERQQQRASPDPLARPERMKRFPSTHDGCFEIEANAFAGQ